MSDPSMDAGPSSPDMAWYTRPELQPNFVNPQLRAYLADHARKPSGSLKFTNRIVFIGSDEFFRDLENFAPVEKVMPGAATPAADLLLIGGDWPRAGEPWREALLNVSTKDVAPLREMIALYRMRGVRSALWLTGEIEAAQAMLHLADAVDAVFVPAPTSFKNAVPLEPGIDVKVFNPFRSAIDAVHEDAPFFRFLIDGAHELSNQALPVGLAPFLDFNSWLIDSAYHYQIPNMKFDAAWRRRFIGYVGAASRASLMQMANGVFLPEVLRRTRPVYFRKRAREAAACKALVFSDGVAKDAIVLDSSDPSPLLRLERDEVGRLARAQRAWREVLSRHTMFERLQTIFAAANVKPVYNEPFQPAINVVMPTLRPEMIPFALGMFQRQTYQHLTLTIVTNGVAVPEKIANLINETPNVHLHSVPRDKTIGYCMNFGINQEGAEYWAKWDDDDIYGPHYFEDQMLQRKYTDFDVAGKAAIFSYLEERDCIYARNFSVRDSYAKHVGGGTLVAKNPGRYFAEDGRGGEDRAFLLLAQERGDKILAGDPFNFVQVRRADAISHTWTFGAHAQDLRGPQRGGFSLGSILL